MMADSPLRTDFSALRGSLEPSSTIIAVGGGKGGVGKSLVSSSLAIFLAQLGYETLLIDLDLGAANLHTLIGQGASGKGINEFLINPELSLSDVITRTPFTHLKIISGSSEVMGIANLDDIQRTRLMSAIYRYPSQYIVLDLSAGTHHTTLDFFLMATRRLVVFNPEPSSVENAYRFMKSAFFRKLRRFEFQLRLKEYLDNLMENRVEKGIKTPVDLIRALSSQDPTVATRLHQVLGHLSFDVVLNQVRSIRDSELGPSIQSVCFKYFGVPCQYLGHIEHDNAVWQSLRKRRHLIMEYPHSRAYTQLMSIARRLTHAQLSRAVV